jgi:hypothetical protein
MKYTFCNSGNCIDFKPNERITPYSQKHPISSLEFYKEQVQQANSKSVYILDEAGNPLGSDETYQTYSKKFAKAKKKKNS